jgi:hypothetical protein
MKNAFDMKLLLGALNDDEDGSDSEPMIHSDSESSSENEPTEASKSEST